MRRIADFIFEANERMIDMNISEMAAACHVSTASISRFTQLLDFKNYKTFQLEMMKSFTNARGNGNELNHAGPPNNRITFEYTNTSPQDSAEEVAKKVFQSNIQMLSDTMQTIDYKKLAQVTELILNARNVVFFGVGRSYITAESGRIRLYRLGINSFSYADAQEQIVAATTCNEHDVFFGISNFGHSAAVVRNIERAKLRGAATIGITSVDGSPLTQVVDTCFLTAFNVANMDFRTNKQAFEPACENITQMVLLDCIYMNVALKQNKPCFDMFYNTVKVLSEEQL
jgi:DNA-binding MurR/RpiR family transcriptional regulator